MSKVIVVASGKGGTGKTMFAANLGATLARQGHKVVLVDLDTGLRNLDLYLGLENNIVYDVNDVLTGAVSYTHLRAHETGRNLVCRLLLEKKKNTNKDCLLYTPMNKQ